MHHCSKTSGRREVGRIMRSFRSVAVPATLLVTGLWSAGCRPDAPDADPATVRPGPVAEQAGQLRSSYLPHTGGLQSSAAALDGSSILKRIPTLAPPPVSDAAQLAFLDTAAQAAWSFVRRNYQARTGLVAANETYQYVTAWDMAS